MRALAVLALLPIALAAGCGGSSPQASTGARQTTMTTDPAPASWTTLRHQPTRFRVQAPPGSTLRFANGLYVVRSGGHTATYSRSVSGETPARFGDQLLRQVGGSISSRSANGETFLAEVDRGGTRETFLVRRSGDRLAVTTGRGLAATDVRRIAFSADGGVVLRPASTPGAGAAGSGALELIDYRAPDGGATAKVPKGWTVNSGGGILDGSGPTGSFLLGKTFNVFLPQSAQPGSQKAGALVSDYIGDPGQAVAQLFPMVSSRLAGFRVRKVVRSGVLPSFTTSGMYVFDFTRDGKPWVSVATVGVDAPAKYSNFLWAVYWSGVSVPADAPAGVGESLRAVWRSWNPGGAIAQRSAQTQQLLSSGNDVWQQTSEFRARQADRQSRDVGCLLQGYSKIEDNSRAYDLPPLPCDQQYAPGG